MAINFPVTYDTFVAPGPGTYMDDPGFEGDVLIGNALLAINEIERKIGYQDTSVQNSPLANTVLQSLNNGRSLWAKVPAAAIENNTIHQISKVGGSTSSPTKSGTSFTLMPEMLLTFTPRANNVGVMLLFEGSFYCDTQGCILRTAFKVDSSAEQDEVQYQYPITLSSYTSHLCAMAWLPALSAVAHTLSVSWATLNSGTWTASGALRKLIAVEYTR